MSQIHYIRGSNCLELNGVDVDNSYGKLVNFATRLASSVKDIFEHSWINHHRNPFRFCSDSEFSVPILRKRCTKKSFPVNGLFPTIHSRMKSMFGLADCVYLLIVLQTGGKLDLELCDHMLQAWVPP